MIWPLFRIEEYRPPRALTVEFDTPVQENNNLMTYEYGTTVTGGYQDQT